MTFIIGANFASGQHLKSGEYGYIGLKIAVDSSTNILTGYFENYTGWDEETQNPKFSCIFYIVGEIKGENVLINTFYPKKTISGEVKGEINIIEDSIFSIKLTEEHGGCWNVEHFADQLEVYELQKAQKWIQIRYVDKAKTYFHKTDSQSKKLKSYLIQGDFVKVMEIKNEWALCIYDGKKSTCGWIKLADLNQM